MSQDASPTESNVSISETLTMDLADSTLLKGNLWWVLLLGVTGGAFIVLLLVSLCVQICIWQRRRALEQLQEKQQRRLERAASEATIAVSAYDTDDDDDDDAESRMDFLEALDTDGSF